MSERDESTTHLAPGSAKGDPHEQRSAEYWLPPVGSVLAGKYRIEGLLGRGGMGVVALGNQLELERAVAIKFLRAGLAVDARPLQRFAREARIVARMRSEHVVRVFDVGRESQVPFIVMELLRGHDLSKELERGPLAVGRAVEFALHACEALGEAHSLGIVHRDVKPSNLFVAEGFGGKELLKVLDFGVSKWLAPAVGLATTSSDDGAVGTPAFASPEQLTHPERIDCRTDVWALGVVLYQALSGSLPFKADTIPALYSRIIGGEPAPFPVRGDTPAELVAVIERCLCREPGDRYASMLELARALAGFAPGRALGILDSLATLPSPARADAPSALPEPTSPVATSTTTLEFGGSIPGGAEPAGSARARRSGRMTVPLLFASLFLCGSALWWLRSAAVRPAPAAANHLVVAPVETRVTLEPAPSAVVALEPSAVVKVTEPRRIGGATAKRKSSPRVTENSALPGAMSSASAPAASSAPTASAAPPPNASAAPGDGIPLYRR